MLGSSGKQVEAGQDLQDQGRELLGNSQRCKHSPTGLSSASRHLRKLLLMQRETWHNAHALCAPPACCANQSEVTRTNLQTGLNPSRVLDPEGDGAQQQGTEPCQCLYPAGRDGRGMGAAKKLPGCCCGVPALQAAWQTPPTPLHPGVMRPPRHTLLLKPGDASSTPSAP